MTLVLPVKDRPSFAERLFDYLESVDGGSDLQILVGDGSLSPASAEAYQRVCERHKLRLDYHRFSPDTGPTQYRQKLLEMSRQIDSEFCCLASDDDFPVVPNLFQAVQSLADSEASAWMGETVDFDVVGSLRRVGGLLRIGPQGRDCGGRYAGRRSALGNFSERLSQSANVFPWGAVTRTAVLRGAVQALWQAEADPWEFEKLLAYQMLLSGSVLSGSAVVAFRQNNTPRNYGGSNPSSLFQKENLEAMRRAISNLIPPPGIADNWQTEMAWDYSEVVVRRALRRLSLARSPTPLGRLRRLGKKISTVWAVALPTKSFLDRGDESVRESLRSGDPGAADSLDLIREVVKKANR